MGAIFKNDCYRIKVQPTADISSGEVIKAGNIVGVATSAIAANTVGYIQISGEYDVDVTSVTASAGDKITVAAKTLAGVDTTVEFGYAVNAIASTDTVARLWLDSAIDTGITSLTVPQTTIAALTQTAAGTASDTLAASTATAPTEEDFNNLSKSLSGKINAIIAALKSAGVIAST